MAGEADFVADLGVGLDDPRVGRVGQDFAADEGFRVSAVLLCRGLPLLRAHVLVQQREPLSQHLDLVGHARDGPGEVQQQHQHESERDQE